MRPIMHLFGRKPSAVSEAEQPLVTTAADTPGPAEREYATDSIELATFLKTQGYHTSRVEPTSQYRCMFVFNEVPPPTVLVAYAQQSGFLAQCLAGYRGLIRDARDANRTGQVIHSPGGQRYSAPQGGRDNGS